MFQALIILTSRQYCAGPNDTWQWCDTGVSSFIIERDTVKAVDDAAAVIESAVARVTTHQVDVIHLGRK
jgi:hypothetical protein